LCRNGETKCTNQKKICKYLHRNLSEVMASRLGLPTLPPSTLCKIVSNYYAALHHEPNALEFRDIGNGITGNSYEIGELSCVYTADPVLPAQHFCGIDGDGTDHVQCRHSGFAQANKRRNAGLTAGLPGIPPAHICTRTKPDARLQHALDQLIVFLITPRAGDDSGRAILGR